MGNHSRHRVERVVLSENCIMRRQREEEFACVNLLCSVISDLECYLRQVFLLCTSGKRKPAPIPQRKSVSVWGKGIVTDRIVLGFFAR